MAIGIYFDKRLPVPMPSTPQSDERLVDLPISVSAKVLLLNKMLAQAVTPTELARRMCTTKQEVNRLIDLKHATKIDRLGAAMQALGRELAVIAT